MSLIDRSFEEVCAIMDRTGDMVDLLVEHATDFRMCDLLDDNQPPPPQPPSTGPRKSGDGPIGLGLVPGKRGVACAFYNCDSVHRNRTEPNTFFMRQRQIYFQTRNPQKSRLRPRLDASCPRHRYNQLTIQNNYTQL